MKNTFLIIIVILFAAGGFYTYKNFFKKAEAPVVNNDQNQKPAKKIILKGRIVWGGEVRTFQPCGLKDEVTESQWIDGKSPALNLIKTAYEKEMAGTGLYSPMYAEVVGSEVSVPDDGFGADYKKAISISEIVLGLAIGSCKSDMIILENIRSGDYIDSQKPLELTGRARGNWYFEANFPIQILDNHANVLANGYATAQGEWMTTEFVPFISTINFSKTPSANSFGKIILKKDNPSDMRELDDQMEVFVYFK